MKYGCTLTLLLVAAFLFGCSSDEIAPGGSGMLEAEESIVSAETSGRVIETFVRESHSFAVGDTLLVIDPTDAQLQLSTAEASRDAARARLDAARISYDQANENERYLTTERDRVSRLVSSGTATTQRLDQLSHEVSQAEIHRRTASANIRTIQAEIEVLEAQIAQINERLADCYPVSPLSGVVTEKYIDIGELLSPGKPMAKISRVDTMWVKVYLPTAHFADITVGDRAKVDTESGGSSYEGWVEWTASDAEFTPKNIQTEKSRTNLVYAVKVRVPNTDGRLKIGMPVYVTLQSK